MKTYRTYTVEVKFHDTGMQSVIYVHDCSDRVQAIATICKSFPTVEILEVK